MPALQTAIVVNDAILGRFLSQAADRLAEAARSGNPAAIRAAREAVRELQGEISQMETSSPNGH